MRNRTRTIVWKNPTHSSRDAANISGFDYLCAIRDGNITPPPVAKLIGYRIVDVEQGRAIFELEPGEYHYNPFSTVHGGMITTLLDTAMTAAVMSTIPKGQGCATLEIKTNFIRPVTLETGLI